MQANIYEPQAAAEFLKISLDELRFLAQLGYLTLRQYKNRQFFLGGELDCIKNDVQRQLGNKPAGVPHSSRSDRPVLQTGR